MLPEITWDTTYPIRKVIDPIKLAFEQYATGEWTVADLADHLAACGLNTRATPKIPSQPVNLKTLHKVLVNPYYKGIVKYKGIEYQGSPVMPL